MADPFMGEIRMFGFAFPPRGHATCDGQIISIAQNSALFALLGVTYGGNGTTTFALPDLRGRAPIHVGQGPGLSNRTFGESGGTETHTLTAGELPAHTHAMRAAGAPDATAPGASTLLAEPGGSRLYRSGASPVALATSTLAPVGGHQPHSNMQPYTVVNFSIAIEGIFPSRN